MIDREELREYLSSVYDLERLITKITYQSANPRDLIAFKQSIGMLGPIKTLLDGFHSHLLRDLNASIDDLKDLCIRRELELIETETMASLRRELEECSNFSAWFKTYVSYHIFLFSLLRCDIRDCKKPPCVVGS